MFTKVLVANRGEIAVRIMRTLREMNIATVAVYSAADEHALHVLTADEAVLLGGAEPRESYLNIERVLDAAKRTGAEAVHPGYGFLAENAAFAQAVVDAGLGWIGPPPEVIARLGNKVAARKLMAEHDIPTIPGATLTEISAEAVARAAEAVGFPVLVKAVAGGGGKGMRIAGRTEGLIDVVEQASSEARAAFGDGTVYLERYLDRPRHVEFQILADTHGNVVHLGERECSIQRRYQKIIEETPSPALDEPLRVRMGEAAVRAAQAAGYVNAGTVEFMLGRSKEFYFLEVNTRLQVEHPITEMAVGFDLVRRQLEIANGEGLGLTQKDVSPRGHGLECRIYAEDPEADFMPAPGKVLFVEPAAGPDVRFDSGIYAGYQVPVEYDPLLGKLIVWAEDRPAAIARMVRALRENVILGVKTTTEFMLDTIRTPAFEAGDTHTRFIEQHLADWRPSPLGDEQAMLAYAADELTGFARAANAGGQRTAATDDDGPSPWHTLGAWDLLD